MNDDRSLPPAAGDELRALVERACAGTISLAEAARLRALLGDDVAAQRFYLHYVDIHARLCWEFGHGAPANDGQNLPAGSTTSPAAGGAVDAQIPAKPPAVAFSLHRWQRWGALAGLAAVLLGLFLWRGREPQPDELDEALPAVAIVTSLVDPRWNLDDEVLAVGTRLAPGVLRLRAGLAEITFDDGCVLLLEAPAEIELLAPSRAFLREGRAYVRVEEPGRNFTVDTLAASVLDAGTSFGIAVERSGATLVQVFSGAVIATSKHDGQRHELQAGLAVQFDHVPATLPREVEFSPERFVRTISDDPAARQTSGHPFNRSRHDRIHIVPAPAGIAIDGDLSDWDLSGEFHSACDEPYASDHFVAGAMMYDAEHLYVGAHVGDPEPLRSILNPAHESGDVLCWRGGSVQVRVSTSPELGWPLEGETPWPGKTRYGNRPCDTSPHIVHLTLWYYAPGKQPCLHIDYGMDMRGHLVNPAGYRGAFRQDDDGRGYVVEYAVPWRLLSAADRPPRGGDMLAASWMVHWSDQGGRRWKGHLVEILNPDAHGETYVFGRTWGRAIYHPHGALPPEVVAPRRSPKPPRTIQ